MHTLALPFKKIGNPNWFAEYVSCLTSDLKVSITKEIKPAIHTETQFICSLHVICVFKESFMKSIEKLWRLNLAHAEVIVVSMLIIIQFIDCKIAIEKIKRGNESHEKTIEIIQVSCVRIRALKSCLFNDTIELDANLKWGVTIRS